LDETTSLRANIDLIKPLWAMEFFNIGVDFFDTTLLFLQTKADKILCVKESSKRTEKVHIPNIPTKNINTVGIS
jgi:hypothetical protein